MSYRIKILSVGKTKESWLEEAVQEYVKRLKPIASFDFSWAKNDEQLLEWASREERVICLDPAGELMTSEQFSASLLNHLEKGGSRLTFIIGGAEGLPAELKRAPLMSLSPLTMTHQIVRLILIEQIYRGFEIAKGTKYHK